MKDKRNQLLEAAIDLFSREGFWNTSTARISKHAKVATGTLFNYFPSKEILIDEVYILLKHELLEGITHSIDTSLDIRDIFRHIWTHYIDWGVKHPARFLLLEQLRLSDLVSQKTQDQIMSEYGTLFELIEKGQNNNALIDIPIDYLVSLIIVNIENSVKYAIDRQLEGKAFEEFCTKGFKALANGISTDKSH